MTVLTIPYMIPLFLGMTFDARTSKPGVSIFDESEISKATVNPVAITTSIYKIVSGMKEIREALDISGEMALKMKTGDFDAKGAGSYIKNEDFDENSVIILSRFRHIARSLTLPSKAKPRKNWSEDFSANVLGTHFVETVDYGVEMVAAVKFTATTKKHSDEIKASLQASLGSGKKTWEVNGGAKLETAVKKVNESSNLEITFFGTIPLTTIPNTIEGLKELIKNFRTLVTASGLDKGLPMRVTLQELSTLEKKPQFTYDVKPDVESDYQVFIDRFNELSTARSQLFSWTRSLPYDLSDQYSSEIGEMLEKLNKQLDACYELMDKVDLTGKDDQFESILNAEVVDVRSLIRRIDRNVNRDLHVTSASYVHWGNTTCKGKANQVKKLVEGYTVGSTTEGIGGFVKYDCMPSANVATAYSLNKLDERSLITGICYGDLGTAKSKLFKGEDAKYVNKDVLVPCAKCHQLDASTVSMFPAANNCPRHWDLVYTGYLMSPGTSESHSAQYICVDEYPTDPRTVSKAVTDKDNSLDLTVLRNEKSLPSQFKENEIVPCAVCALKGGRIV